MLQGLVVVLNSKEIKSMAENSEELIKGKTRYTNYDNKTRVRFLRLLSCLGEKGIAKLSSLIKDSDFNNYIRAGAIDEMGKLYGYCDYIVIPTLIQTVEKEKYPFVWQRAIEILIKKRKKHYLAKLIANKLESVVKNPYSAFNSDDYYRFMVESLVELEGSERAKFIISEIKDKLSAQAKKSKEHTYIKSSFKKIAAFLP